MGTIELGLPGLAGVESTPACNDTVWDRNIAFPTAGLNPSDLGAVQLFL